MNGGRRVRQGGTAWLAVVALAVLGLSACTHNDPPPVSPTTSSASAQPSPTVTPPTAPKAAPTAKSAEAFMRYVWYLYNYSYDASDTRLLQSISEASCDFCRGVVDEVAESKISGATTEGGRITILVTAAPPGRIQNFIVVSSVLRQEAGRVLDANHQVVRTSPALDSVTAHARLEWRSETWHVAALTIDKKPN